MADKNNPVNWFEIPTTDLERAISFYQKVFGFELKRQEMGPMRMAWFPMGTQESPGATGSLVQGEGYRPSLTGTTVYFSVEDIDATMNRVKGSGGRVLLPKNSIGQYGYIAQFQDTEGNRVAVHSMK